MNKIFKYGNTHNKKGRQIDRQRYIDRGIDKKTNIYRQIKRNRKNKQIDRRIEKIQTTNRCADNYDTQTMNKNIRKDI